MTSHKLALKLLSGPDVIVTTHAYEGEVNEITMVDSPGNLRINPDNPDGETWYYGKLTYTEDETAIRGIHLR